MTIEINIMHNFDAIEGFFTNIMQDVATPAVKTAINRSLVTGRKETLKEIHKRIYLNTRIKTKTDFGKNNVKIFKASGTNPFNMEGTLAFSSNSLPMLYFARGNVNNIKQKGIKVSKRKKVKIEIFKGKKFTLKKAFIQTHNSKQVFKRDGNKAMVKQGIPSLSHMVENSRLKDNIRKLMQKRFANELKSQFKWRLDKEVKKASGLPIKKAR